jgi:hypothetical protein
MVPTGVAVFACTDVAIRRLAERDHKIVHRSRFERRCHHAGMEAPDVPCRTAQSMSTALG